jgi:hypothetical protein
MSIFQSTKRVPSRQQQMGSGLDLGVLNAGNTIIFLGCMTSILQHRDRANRKGATAGNMATQTFALHTEVARSASLMDVARGQLVTQTFALHTEVARSKIQHVSIERNERTSKNPSYIILYLQTLL